MVTERPAFGGGTRTLPSARSRPLLQIVNGMSLFPHSGSGYGSRIRIRDPDTDPGSASRIPIPDPAALYPRTCTSSVRPLCGWCRCWFRPAPVRLPVMATPAAATAFITGAGGFLGTWLVKVLVARGHQVFGLTGTLPAADRVRRAGAIPVMGDLLEPGQWQDEAAADWVFHLPPHPMCRLRVTRSEAQSIAAARLRMDAHLLDAVAGGVTRQIVYVGDTACYGPVGPRPITEDEPPQRSAWGELPPACARPARRLRRRRIADHHRVCGLGIWALVVVPRTDHRAS